MEHACARSVTEVMDGTCLYKDEVRDGTCLYKDRYIGKRWNMLVNCARTDFEVRDGTSLCKDLYGGRRLNMLVQGWIQRCKDGNRGKR